MKIYFITVKFNTGKEFRINRTFENVNALNTWTARLAAKNTTSNIVVTDTNFRLVKVI